MSSATLIPKLPCFGSAVLTRSGSPSWRTGSRRYEAMCTPTLGVIVQDTPTLPTCHQEDSQQRHSLSLVVCNNIPLPFGSGIYLQITSDLSLGLCIHHIHLTMIYRCQNIFVGRLDHENKKHEIILQRILN